VTDGLPTPPLDAVATAAGHAPAAPSIPPEDMIDMPADFVSWPFLREVLDEYRDVLTQTYLESDRASLAAQAKQRRWVLYAAFSATLAVSLAILQLAMGLHNRYIVLVNVTEVVAVIMAWCAFRAGEHFRKQWLRERHKAERCRFFKFGSLISPDLYEQDAPPFEQRVDQLGGKIQAIRKLVYKDVLQWLDDDNMPSPPGRTSPRNLEEMAQLRDYYRDRRLKSQVAYFERQSQRNVKRDNWWRRVPPRLFTASVIIVGLHAAIESVRFLIHGAGAKAPETGNISRFEISLIAFIVLAAVLPVLGSGIRTWRSAHESTRNMSRFRSKRVALQNISDRLTSGPIKDAAEAEAVLRDLWCAEQIMESEHREWLRLMMEAEWMG
jgi:hypothetical protein